MTFTGLRNRLKKLLSGQVDPEHCDAGLTLRLTTAEGEPVPAIPAAAPYCPVCCQPHVLFLDEVIAKPPGETQADP
jgi:hypothetical protein